MSPVIDLPYAIFPKLATSNLISVVRAIHTIWKFIRKLARRENLKTVGNAERRQESDQWYSENHAFFLYNYLNNMSWYNDV